MLYLITWYNFKLVLLIYLLYVFVKHLKLYLRMKEIAQNKNSVLIYAPFLGFVYRFLKKRDPKDPFKFMKEKLNEMDIKKKDVIITNTPMTSVPVVLLVDPKLIAEFYSKETSVSKRFDSQGENKMFEISLFYDHGDIALTRRGAFVDIFRNENLHNITKAVTNAVDSELRKIELGNEGKELDFYPILSSIFHQIINKTLFGETTGAHINEKTITEYVLKILVDTATHCMKPQYFFLGGFLTKNNLSKEGNEIKKRIKIANEAILQNYRLIESQIISDTSSFLGAMNSDNEELKLKEKDILGLTFILTFAAYDTSKNTTAWAMYYLSQMKEERDILLKEANQLGLLGDDINPEKLESAVRLECFIKEVTRLGAMFNFLELRELLKNTKIGDYKLKKGELVAISILWNHFKESQFPDAFTFKSERHMKENTGYHRMNFIPFGFGKRACLGKHLAMWNMKIIILRVLKFFEISKADFDKTNGGLPFNNINKSLVKLTKKVV